MREIKLLLSWIFAAGIVSGFIILGLLIVSWLISIALIEPTAKRKHRRRPRRQLEPQRNRKNTRPGWRR